MPKIITLKTKADISSFITENFNGTETKFLVADFPKNKQERLINLLSNLLEKLEGFDILHEGKIDYGFRNKRIEIVFYKKPVLFLAEISDSKKLDRKVLELNDLINHEIRNSVYQNIVMVGCIFYETDLEQDMINNIEDLASNNFLFLNINDPSIFETIKNYVLSH